MARIPRVSRDDIPENERAAYDAFLEKRGGKLNAGPYSLLLHVPEAAQRFESLRLWLREQASLPQKVQELVMLTVAREMDCAYIWYAHAPAARAIGIAGEVVDALREKKDMTGLDRAEQAAVDFARELLRGRKVSQGTFDRAEASFGRRGTAILTNLVGAYAALAYFMNAYELEAPSDPAEKRLPV